MKSDAEAVEERVAQAIFDAQSQRLTMAQARELAQRAIAGDDDAEPGNEA